ncbi:MAG: DUF6636 domain-containing protein [Sulfitobacter sp.]
MLFRFLISIGLFASPVSADVWTFATPSGNIECVVGEGFEGSDIECTIYRRSEAAMVPQLAGCPLSRGVTFFMYDRGGVRATCTPASWRPSGGQSIAEYNVSGDFGGFSCHSATSGLQCRNLDGHGFHLSRANQQIF